MAWRSLRPACVLTKPLAGKPAEAGSCAQRGNASNLDQPRLQVFTPIKSAKLAAPGTLLHREQADNGAASVDPRPVPPCCRQRGSCSRPTRSRAHPRPSGWPCSQTESPPLVCLVWLPKPRSQRRVAGHANRCASGAGVSGDASKTDSAGLFLSFGVEGSFCTCLCSSSVLADLPPVKEDPRMSILPSSPPRQ